MVALELYVTHGVLPLPSTPREYGVVVKSRLLLLPCHTICSVASLVKASTLTHAPTVKLTGVKYGVVCRAMRLPSPPLLNP